jgi:hypothetical protein
MRRANDRDDRTGRYSDVTLSIRADIIEFTNER